MSSDYGEFQLGMADGGDPSVAAAVMSAIRRKQLIDQNTPPPPDPYGTPQPSQSPDQVVGAAPSPSAGPQAPTPSGDPYGAPMPVSDADLKAALDAYTGAYSQPMPSAPLGYGRHGIFTGQSTQDYDAKMAARQAAIAAAKEKFEGLQEINKLSALEQEQKARGVYYTGGGRQDARTKWEDAYLQASQTGDQAKLQTLKDVGDYMGWKKPTPEPRAPNAWEVATAKPGTYPQDMVDLAKRAIGHDYPQNTPAPKGYIPGTIKGPDGQDIPASYDLDRGIYIDPITRQPITGTGFNKAGTGRAPAGGTNNWRMMATAEKNVRAAKLMQGDTTPPSDEEIAAEAMRLGGGQQGGQGAAPRAAAPGMGRAVARAPRGTPDGPIKYQGQPATVAGGVIYVQ